MSTVVEALGEATRRLAGAGVASPAADARRLLADLLGVSGDRLAMLRDDLLTPDQMTVFGERITRRSRFEPVSHIVGYRDFWKHRFKVTGEVLDPRPETEVLVELSLASPLTRVLDLGTGSGCILISILAECPDANGVGTDASEAALAVAAANVRAANVQGRAELNLSDWFTGVTGMFDLIVSNPPYIAELDWQSLDPDVREWEPRNALTDGGDGLAAYRAIADGAARHMTADGRLLLEIGPDQAQAVQGLLISAGFDAVSVHPDLDGRDRVVSARLPKPQIGKTPQS